MMISLLRRRLQRLRDQGERGSILILVVLSALIIVGSSGLAIDVGRLYAAKAELSRAVDAAALSGVLEFNGTPGGLTNASTKACAYLQANEPTASCSGISPNGGNSTLTINANKTVRLYFLPIFGINTSVVSAHAISGFNNATVDAALVIDSTGSMSGTSIQQAKIAANNFKDTLLGNSPTGNVVVGVAPFRGCNRSTSPNATQPWANSQSACVSQETEYTGLTSTIATLNTRISQVCPSDSCTGGSGTNVCTGVAKGWEVLEGAGNHTASQNNRRFMIILSDGDNRYTGSYAYQNAPYVSPHTYQTYPCRPPSSCANVGGDSISASDPCRTGTYTSGTITVATDGFDSGYPASGVGWAANWTTTGTPSVTSGTTQAGTNKAQLKSTDTMVRQVNLGSVYDASISFYVRTSGAWVNTSTTDRFYFETSPDGVTWTTRATYGISGASGITGTISTTYTNFTVSLTPLVGDSSSYIRFRSATSAATKLAFVDTISITDPNSSSAGYLNGDDLSSSCGAAVRRERQLDILTRDMANAAKADGVEIFVVAFGVCSSNNTVPTATDCTTNIGNTDTDSIADQRLLKCLASNKSNTIDHYYYAALATDLPAIFTNIAAQIAHRLVE